jgi:hypothetical protein
MNYKPIAGFSLGDLLTKSAEAELAPEDVGGLGTDWLSSSRRSIAEIMDSVRGRIASISGVRTEAVKLDLKIEY